LGALKLWVYPILVVVLMFWLWLTPEQLSATTNNGSSPNPIPPKTPPTKKPHLIKQTGLLIQRGGHIASPLIPDHCIDERGATG
jgi:hypothetical protein